MTHETLDDMLDRVARETTAVPADATFVARLRPSLDGSERYRVGFTTAAVAAGMLALVIAAALVRNTDSGTRPVTAVTRSGRAEPAPTASEASSAEPARSTPRREAVTVARRASNTGSRTAESGHASVEPTIPPLSSPAELDVAHLALDPLVVHPVEVSDLEIAGLSVTDLGAPDDPKE